MRSYSSESRGFIGFLREAASLYRLHSKDISERVRVRIEDARRVDACVRERFGLELRDLDLLEIGPGQFLMQLTYFAIRNRVVGVDRDVIVRGFKPLGYAAMLKTNGARRTVKTIGRKLMGIDRGYAFQLLRQLNLKRLPDLTVYPMDVCEMSFPRNSFDFVYSRSVFQHLPDPTAALDGIARALRPGGVAYISIHPFTSQTGCLDPRIYTDRRHEVQGWPHLRSHLQHTIEKPNVYLSKLRLEDWRRLFASKMPGAEYILGPSDNSSLEAAKRLQSQGQLLEYLLEELLTGEFVAVWKKPTGSL
jgi:SAM-dependent methyltransferase